MMEFDGTSLNSTYIYIYNYVYNTVMTFKYVKAGPDREAAEVV